MSDATDHTGIILMAAGESRRLGRPKQLLDHAGTPLLARAADTALATGIRPVIVVLGAGADEIAPRIFREDSTIVRNEDWREGMAASLRTGLQALLDRAPDTEAAILMVCDQPFVTAGLLLQLLQRHRETGLPAIASTYAGRMGTPALFHRSLFGELLRLQGDTGARRWLTEHPESVATLPFEKGALDIDTPEDLAAWRNDKYTDPS